MNHLSIDRVLAYVFILIFASFSLFIVISWEPPVEAQAQTPKSKEKSTLIISVDHSDNERFQKQFENIDKKLDEITQRVEWIRDEVSKGN